MTWSPGCGCRVSFEPGPDWREHLLSVVSPEVLTVARMGRAQNRWGETTQQQQEKQVEERLVPGEAGEALPSSQFRVGCALAADLAGGHTAQRE